MKYRVGIMKVFVEGKDRVSFDRTIDTAVAMFKKTLQKELDLEIQVFEFPGPHLTPVSGTYSSLDFLQLGLIEKYERSVHFLFIITEVDLSSANVSSVVALPSKLTNIAVISIKRLSPTFWGHKGNLEITVKRLTALLYHSLGHLLSLPKESEKLNIMYDYLGVNDLDLMQHITGEQKKLMRKNLPIEAKEEIATKNSWMFMLKQAGKNWRSIWRTTRRVNPLLLFTKLPTMITAGLSVVIVLIFTAEIWDAASSFEIYQIVLFSLLAIFFATVALYNVLSLHKGISGDNTTTEQIAVTRVTVFINVFLTVLSLYVSYFIAFFFVILTVFPKQLMATWPTSDPATDLLDQTKMNIFLASMGVLAGSLGGRADSRRIIRRILFLDETT